ncbi:MAG: aspartyl protease family protein [Candidatus Bathyarchaeota archaeon]
MKEVRSIQRDLESADSLFKAGKFARAEKIYVKILNEDPKNHRATARLGEIALLSNLLDDAEKWLTEAIKLKPEEKAAKSLLAEVFYRRDEFQKAAPFFRSLGRESRAKQLESFKGVSPNKIEGPEVTSLKFVITDPLPVVQIRVNNSEPVNVLIDTGGATLIIDSEFAKEVGTVQFEAETGIFAGGKKAAVHQGKVDSVTLGDFTVKNVPVEILPTRRFSSIFGGTRMDGIIGTLLLHQFIATLDYPGGRLILRRRTEQNLKKVEKEAKEQGAIVVPFWMAGDHYMHAWGTVNESEPMLFFVDTGLAGGGFTCPESTLRRANIKLQEDQAGEGIGGGGKVRAIPFMVNELTLGDAKEHNIQGIFTPNTGDLERVVGFQIGGLISHGFFRPYALTFDFAKMRFFLKKKR